MNPLVGGLAIVWLILDVLFLVQAIRDQRLGRLGIAVVQLPILTAFGIAVMAGMPPSGLESFAFWLLTGVVNTSLALVGLNRQPALAVVGVVATVVALILISLGAFSSLPVMAVAAVFCLGSALFPRSPAHKG